MSAKVISIMNQKGGVGKTTLCYHLAHALKELGQKVLCIDMDPQGNLSYLFSNNTCNEYDCDNADADSAKGLNSTSRYKEYSIFPLLLNSIKELKSLHQGIFLNEVIRKSDQIDLIPASQDLSGFELTVAGINSPRQLILNKFLKNSNVLNNYDYILIDAPPTLGLLVINIICACQKIIVPFKADEFSFQGVSHFEEVLENISEMGIIDTPVVACYVPNLIDLRRKKEVEALSRFKESFGDKVFECISSSALFLKAQSDKKSIFDYHSKDYFKWQKLYREMASKLL